MAQSLSLSANLSTQLKLSPQMQQSLALLQATSQELDVLIEKELQQNPLLEESKPADQNEMDAIRDRLDAAEPPSDVRVDPTQEAKAGESVDDFQAVIERFAELNEEFRDHLTSTNIPLKMSSGSDDDEKRQFVMDSLVREVSLQDDLLEQLRLSEISARLLPIAETVIGYLSDAGYLTATVEEIAVSNDFDWEDVEECLDVIQSFDPAGVGARDLRECLMIQLHRQKKVGSLEYRIVDRHLEPLARRKFPEMAKALNVTVQDIQEAAENISRLEYNPGRNYASINHQIVTPEVFVEYDEKSDEYTVSTNKDHLPQLKINNEYKDLIARGNLTSEDRKYLSEKISSGSNFIKSIQQRQDTILKIGKEIVTRQREFFDYGLSHLKPMTMAQVAEVVGVHETTVSRAVNGKFMQTPNGVIEMRFFFSSGIQKGDDENISNIYVKDIIQDMVRNEDTSKPLSDDAIVKILGDKGIKLARRTVAKYRGELGILPSFQRKRY